MSQISQGMVSLDQLENLQESLEAMKQEQSMEKAFATPEKSYDDMDVVKIEVAADDVAVEQPAGMFQRMRQTLFGSPDPKGTTAGNSETKGERQEEDARSVQMSGASNCSQIATPDKQSESKQRSVLDELEHYWEQHDKMSASGHKQGI